MYKIHTMKSLQLTYIHSRTTVLNFSLIPKQYTQIHVSKSASTSTIKMSFSSKEVFSLTNIIRQNMCYQKTKLSDYTASPHVLLQDICHGLRTTENTQCYITTYEPYPHSSTGTLIMCSGT